MYDDYGNYVGDDFAAGTGVSDWTDNGDGSLTDPQGNIFDLEGNWLGYENADGTWTDSNGNVFDANGNPADYSTNTVTDVPEVSVPSNWIDNQNGTVTDPGTGDIWGIDGTYLGNTADAGLGGGNVTLDPDEFGDVYTVNGKWIGNLFGLSAPGSPNATSARGPGQGTPGGAYSSGGSLGGGQGGQGGQQTAQQLAQQLKQMLGAAQNSGGSFNQQAAIANALRNVQAKSSSSSGLLIAGLAAAALGAVVLLRRK